MNYMICETRYTNVNPTVYHLYSITEKKYYDWTSEEAKNMIRCHYAEILNYYITSNGRFQQRSIGDSHYYRNVLMPKLEKVAKIIVRGLEKSNIKWNVRSGKILCHVSYKVTDEDDKTYNVNAATYVKILGKGNDFYRIFYFCADLKENTFLLFGGRDNKVISTESLSILEMDNMEDFLKDVFETVVVGSINDFSSEV